MNTGSRQDVEYLKAKDAERCMATVWHYILICNFAAGLEHIVNRTVSRMCRHRRAAGCLQE